MSNYFRLKPKPSGDTTTTENKSQPLVIQMTSKEGKINMLKIAKNLRKIEGYEKVYINNDLTINERIILKQLIIERNELNLREKT